MENKGDGSKQVLIEHPLQVGYELKQPAKALEKTEKVYRFEVPVAAKKTIVFPVLEEKVRMEQLAILSLTWVTLDFYTRSGEIPAKVKDVLKAAGDKQSHDGCRAQAPAAAERSRARAAGTGKYP